MKNVLHSLALLLLVLLPGLFAPALADYIPTPSPEPIYLPELSDPVDRHMRALAVLSQHNDQFREILYGDYTDLYSNGCSPTSVTNGLIAAMGVRRNRTAMALVTDVLRLMTHTGRYMQETIHPDYFIHLFDETTIVYPQKDLAVWPQLKSRFAGPIAATESLVTLDDVRSILAMTQTQDSPFLLAGRAETKNWALVVEMIHALDAAGRDDAMLVFTRADCGTTDTEGPFRSTGAGHFVTICINVGRYMEDASFYLLDSLPRAIEGEPYGNDFTLHVTYPFYRDSWKNSFGSNYEAFRITESVIRFTPKQPRLFALHALSGETRRAYEKQLLDSVVLYGKMILFVSGGTM